MRLDVVHDAITIDVGVQAWRRQVQLADGAPCGSRTCTFEAARHRTQQPGGPNSIQPIVAASRRCSQHLRNSKTGVGLGPVYRWMASMPSFRCATRTLAWPKCSAAVTWALCPAVGLPPAPLTAPLASCRHKTQWYCRRSCIAQAKYSVAVTPALRPAVGLPSAPLTAPLHSCRRETTGFRCRSAEKLLCYCHTSFVPRFQPAANTAEGAAGQWHQCNGTPSAGLALRGVLFREQASSRCPTRELR